MNTIGSRLGILSVAVSLLLAACSGSDANEKTPGERAKTLTPDWTEISIGNDALPDEPIWNVRTGLGARHGLPALLAGSVASPGKPNRAVVWDSATVKHGAPIRLAVDADESWVSNLSTVGDHTYVVGTTWQDGQQTSFVQRSKDRRSWESVSVPDELTDEDLYLHMVVDDGSGAPIAISSSQEQVAAVDLTSGEITKLPVEEHLTAYGVGGAATIGDTVVVLVNARNERAGDIVIPYRSTDDGRTWTASPRLRGLEDSISGVVTTASGLVATGSRLIGDAHRATAWSSTDGLRWQREAIPHNAVAGWDATLGQPAADAKGVYAAIADSNSIDAQILRRSADGTWEPYGPPTDQWRYPGTSAVLAPQRNGLLVARAEDGRFQVGLQSHRAHGWQFRVKRASDSTAPVSWWTSIRVDGDTIQAVGSHTVMEINGSGNQWFRTHVLSAYSIANSALHKATMMPIEAAGLTDQRSATSPDGTQVVIGEQRTTDAAGNPRSELVGWHKAPGGDWKHVRGLTASRTSYLRSVAYVGNRWVLTGTDAENTWGGHAYGAIWTSTDGRTWQRQRGPFDVEKHLDSGIYDVCELPGGDMLALGGVEDPRTSGRPVAFRRHAQKWTPASVKALGKDLAGFASCTTTGDVTLVTGWKITQQFWRTTDGVGFTPLKIGAEGDHVGEIESVPGGFAAPGTVLERSQLQPVVWLSPDGVTWTPVSIPVSRQMSTSDLTAWGDGLVVPLTSDGGPGIFVLENVGAILASLGK